jgi:hypothetical protein
MTTATATSRGNTDRVGGDDVRFCENVLRIDFTGRAPTHVEPQQQRKVAEQVAAIAARSPDIVALQELTLISTMSWRDVLPLAGLPNVVDSFSSSPSWEPKGPRRYALIVASRFPLTYVTWPHAVPWPERILSV